MYIGPKQIESTQILEGKTFNGSNIYKVIYAGGDSEIISETALNLMQTEEPSDFTAARTKQFNAIRKDLFPLIGAYVSSLALNTEEDKKAASKDFLEKSLILLAEYSNSHSQASKQCRHSFLCKAEGHYFEALLPTMLSPTRFVILKLQHKLVGDWGQNQNLQLVALKKLIIKK